MFNIVEAVYETVKAGCVFRVACCGFRVTDYELRGARLGLQVFQIRI
jgi:hypothetical protein